MTRHPSKKATRLFGLSFLIVILSITNLANAGTNSDGLHTEAWFNTTTGDLSKDLAEASAAGKILAIIWEQPGCEYCRKMHEINLQQEETVRFIREHFYIVMLNMRGDNPVQDFDGRKMSESQLARAHQVFGTPAIEFRNEITEEVARMPGYADPLIFHGVFDFVVSKGYMDSSLVAWLKTNYLND